MPNHDLTHPADPPGCAVASEMLLARAYLSRVAEPPAPALTRFVTTFGPVEAAARVARGAVPDQVAIETAARRTANRARADLDAAAAVGARLLTPEHSHWPHSRIAALTAAATAELAPPLALWLHGPAELDGPRNKPVAVIGARAATGYGMHVAEEIAAGLAASGHTVVAGAALGIDAAAHRGALAVGAPTVAVLACGTDRRYPAAHEVLLERIIATGLLVSEYPPGAVPSRHRFITRYRLIAALTAGTVVVEAAIRSGAHRAAADARALGRPLMAVPGPVTSAQSAGCHHLLRDGAILITHAQDALDVIGHSAPSPDAEPPVVNAQI